MRSIGKLSKPLNNEDGIALVTALMLGMFGMLMVAALLFMVTTGTWLSGSQARRQTALAAAHGANNFFAEEVIQRGIEGTNVAAMGDYNGMLAPGPSAGNFDFKLNNSGFFNGDQGDAIITLRSPTGGPDIVVTATLVSTKRGNSEASESPFLPGPGVADPQTGVTALQQVPALYQIRVEGQRAANANLPVERAQLNSLYMY